jgi:hypothetical protein
MTDEQIALSRRAVVCKGFRWMPGMRTVEVLQAPPWTLPLWDEAIVLSAHEGDPVRVCTVLGKVRELHPLATPCLTDPATLGCLLALVRETWRCPTVYVRQSTTRRVSDGVIAWEVCDLYLDAEACRALGVPREGSVGSWGHGSEAEALVSALESAP